MQFAIFLPKFLETCQRSLASNWDGFNISFRNIWVISVYKCGYGRVFNVKPSLKQALLDKPGNFPSLSDSLWWSHHPGRLTDCSICLHFNNRLHRWGEETWTSIFIHPGCLTSCLTPSHPQHRWLRNRSAPLSPCWVEPHTAMLFSVLRGN